ncbi:MAG: 1-deoxy-D-xylulose-5-phosphate synthase N-terminal domain-containing protein [Thermoplasmata archaeon]
MISFQDLYEAATKLRKELIIKHTETKMAHIGSDMSCLNVLLILYTKTIGDKDKFVLSKGHAALALYSVLHYVGILKDNVYNTLGKDGSLLGEHPLYGIDGLEFATGSLGHGLPLAAGMALAKRMNLEEGTVYVLLSDGECQEGSSLEAMNFIARERFNNIVCIIDSNKWQAYDRTLIPIEKVKKEFEAAGWEDIREVDGSKLEDIYSALAEGNRNGPRLVISHSVMSMGVRSMEDKLEWHYRPPTKEQAERFIKELEER